MTANRFCQACGALLTPGKRFCGACGQLIVADGGGMPPSPMAAPPKVRAAPARSHLVVVLLAFLLILVVGGEVIWWFLWQNKPNATETVATPSSPSASSPSATPSSPYPPARTGNITTGPAAAAASQTIDSSGGTIAISEPGDPLDGFVIDVPANSYADSRTFAVSYAPVTQQTFGSDIHPISPMITVDNGGGYSDELMYVRVPVKVPEGSFAMGFLYDEQSKQLEGMPLVGRDADSITVATRHFSNFFISMIDEALLKKNINSGFQPGIDDWQFNNVCSYIAPGGHCTGQTIAAMWYYYTKPDGKEAHLYNRYDNNGNPPATPTLWQDDSLAYRFCSTIHQDYAEYGEGTKRTWDALAGIGWKFEDHKWKSFVIPGIGDASTWKLFVYSIQASGQPQLVSIASNAGGGHALICYAVSDNGTLRVADPNYHGRDDRIIEYAEGKFKPYNSGANKADIDAGKGTAYEKIAYQGAWTIVPYDKIAGRWTEFKDKTTGNDRFPAYKIVYGDEKGQYQELTDGTTFAVNKVNFYVDFNGTKTGVNVFRDGVELPWDSKGAFELKPGNNLLGIWIRKEVGTAFQYVDFKYINVIYSSLTLTPTTQEAEPGKTITFDLELTEAAPQGFHFEWLVDGVLYKSGYDFSIDVSFPTEGTHIVAVKVVDSAGKVLMQAQGTAVIMAQPTSISNLEQLHGMLSFQLEIFGKHTYNLWQAPDNNTTQVFDSISCPGRSWGFRDIDSMPITWNGTSFSGTIIAGHYSDEDIYTVNGSVSSDGASLVSLSYSRVSKTKNEYQYSEQTVKIEVSGGIPIWSEQIPVNTITGAGVSKYVSSISDVYDNYDAKDGSKLNHKEYASTEWSSTYLQEVSIYIGFYPQREPYIMDSNGNFVPDPNYQP